MAHSITLESDAALVLFELLASEKIEPHVELAERNALWELENALEEILAEPFSPQYAELLEQARKSLAERYEG